MLGCLQFCVYIMCVPVIPVLWRPRQEHQKFSASLDVGSSESEHSESFLKYFQVIPGHFCSIVLSVYVSRCYGRLLSGCVSSVVHAGLELCAAQAALEQRVCFSLLSAGLHMSGHHTGQ